jgi:Ca-activated chloride channel homolog
MAASLVRFAWLLSAACLLTQAPGQIPTFRSEVRTVAVYATVTDREGRLVPDLPETAFQVFEDGRRVPTTLFSNDVQRITVAIMLDMSGSMTSEVLRVRESTQRFIDALAPGDRVRIGSFGNEIAISPLVTGDKEVLTRVMREELWPGGFTPLWRALDRAMTSLEGETGRRVVLTLSDGRDTDAIGGSPGPGAVKRRAVRESFMVYAIGMGGAAGPTVTYNVSGGSTVLMSGTSSYAGLSSDLADVAEETGGGHFALKQGANLGDTFARVAEELRHQYLIGFAMTKSDGKVHKVDVRIGEPGCSVRTRRSYVASGDAR